MDLEVTSFKVKDLEDDKVAYKKREEILQKNIADLDSSLAEARLALGHAKEMFDRELSQKLEDQRMKW